MKREDKRGVTNIEMVVALVLFIFAVFGMILVFSVYQKPSVSSSNALDIFEQKFLGQAQEYKEVGVNVSPSSSPPDCFEIPLNDNFNGAKENFSVYSGTSKLGFKVNDPYDGNISIKKQVSGIYKIYLFNFSVLSSVPPPTGPCDITGYNYTLPFQGKIFDYAHLTAMNRTYYTDYASLRETYGKDFILILRDESGSELISMKRAKPVNAEIFSREFRVMIYNDGIVNAVVHLEIW